MSSLARLILAASRKRKEREGSVGYKAPPIKPRLDPSKPAIKPSPLGREEPSALLAKSRLLAGYLAHEFLTKGTLLGKPFDPLATAEPAPAEHAKAAKVYADVAYLLKFDGTHIPGVVNPTELDRWIQNGGGLGP